MEPMNRRRRTVPPVFLWGMLLACHADPIPVDLPEIDPDDVPVAEQLAAVRAQQRFGSEILARLAAATPDRNLLIAPGSLHGALSMAAAAAGGRTLEQMRKALAFELEGEAQERAQGALVVRLVRDVATPNSLSIASRLFGSDAGGFHQETLDRMRLLHGAPLWPVDFVGDAEGARQSINRWVGERTRGIITRLLPPGSVDAMTRLVLASAVHFKGVWSEPFDPQRTESAPFLRGGAEPVEVPFMRSNEEYLHAELDGTLALVLPYAGETVSMLVLLPERIEDELVRLGPKRFAEVEQALESRQVELWLPRFRFRSHMSLDGELRALGMSDAFDPQQADFSPLTDEPGMFIQAVLHQTFIEVNEEGTEAAGATGVMMGVTSMPVQPALFRADRPFLFALRHDGSGAVLFLGVVADPSRDS